MAQTRLFRSSAWLRYGIGSAPFFAIACCWWQDMCLIHGDKWRHLDTLTKALVSRAHGRELRFGGGLWVMLSLHRIKPHRNISEDGSRGRYNSLRGQHGILSSSAVSTSPPSLLLSRTASIFMVLACFSSIEGVRNSNIGSELGDPSGLLPKRTRLCGTSMPPTDVCFADQVQ